MQIFNEYYGLKTLAKLPVGASFVEPIDKATFIVESGQTMPQFIKKIQEYREKKGFEEIEKNQLLMMIEMALFESTPQEIKKQYFVKKPTPPTLKDVSRYMNFVLKKALNKQSPSNRLRQGRASKCLNCPQHKKYANKVESKMNLLSRKLLKTVKLDNLGELGSCMACGCNMELKIGQPILPVLASTSPQMVQKIVNPLGKKAFESCWILNEGLTLDAYRPSTLSKINKASPRTQELLQEYIADAKK